MRGSMSIYIKWLLALAPSAPSPSCALLSPRQPLPADKAGASEASEPKDDAAGDAAKPDDEGDDADEAKDEGKPDEAPPPDAKAEDAPPAGAGEIQSGVKMKDLLAEGFLIRTTVLVPADAVTRQLGKVSAGCHHPDPAKRNGDRGLLLHAQGLCEGEPDRYRLLHRVPLGEPSRSCATRPERRRSEPMSVRRLAAEQPEGFAFTPENLDWAKDQIKKYPQGRAGLRRAAADVARAGADAAAGCRSPRSAISPTCSAWPTSASTRSRPSTPCSISRRSAATTCRSAARRRAGCAAPKR